MKALLIVGIIMIVLGGAVLAYRGITYTSEETVLDIGPLQATAQTQETIPLPALLGWALVVGGGIAAVGGIVAGRKS